MKINCVRLYYLYHFHPEIKSIGAEITEFNISDDYIKTVIEIQKTMQKEISKKNIAIETNPTSNYMVGRLGKYSNYSFE